MCLISKIVTLTGSVLTILPFMGSCLDSDDVEPEVRSHSGGICVRSTIPMHLPDALRDFPDRVVAALVLHREHTVSDHEIVIDFNDGLPPVFIETNTDATGEHYLSIRAFLEDQGLYVDGTNELFLVQSEDAHAASGTIEVTLAATVVNKEGGPVTFNWFTFIAVTHADLEDPLEPGRVLLVHVPVEQAPGDCDFDGDADLRDFVRFQACVGSDPMAECQCADRDLDSDVDLDDYAVFYSVLTGPFSEPADYDDDCTADTGTSQVQRASGDGGSGDGGRRWWTAMMVTRGLAEGQRGRVSRP